MSQPPLNAVRAFVAAARRLSFQGAARELCVTPGAISRQMNQDAATNAEDASRGAACAAGLATAEGPARHRAVARGHSGDLTGRARPRDAPTRPCTMGAAP